MRSPFGIYLAAIGFQARAIMGATDNTLQLVTDEYVREADRKQMLADAAAPRTYPSRCGTP
ncbi:hypothetical protein MesoLjLb_36040 [Mesorhizobium sp. L-8-3]|nr:hypothetical protein MesoLjLb_36040 [Mesorhizobium sp. L-8-3]